MGSMSRSAVKLRLVKVSGGALRVKITSRSSLSVILVRISVRRLRGRSVRFRSVRGLSSAVVRQTVSGRLVLFRIRSWGRSWIRLKESMG